MAHFWDFGEKSARNEYHNGQEIELFEKWCRIRWSMMKSEGWNNKNNLKEIMIKKFKLMNGYSNLEIDQKKDALKKILKH